MQQPFELEKIKSLAVDPAIQKKLNDQLSLFIYDSERDSCHPTLDAYALKKIEDLLQSGGDPNYQNHNGRTLIIEAISLLNLPLLTLALRYGADVNHHYIAPRLIADPSKTDEIFEYALNHKDTTLQQTIDKYFICRRYERPEGECLTALRFYDLIAERFTLPAKYIIDEKLLEKIYLELHEKIIHALNTNNIKPLLVVLGERHTSLVSFLIELMVLLICNQFGFKNLLTETDKGHLKIVQQGKRIPGSFDDWKTIYDLVPFAASLQYQIVPVDLGVFGAKKIGKKSDDYEEIKPEATTFDARSREGLEYRDQVIYQVIKDGIQNDSVLIVGSSHLIGLNNKDFSNHHVLFINVTNYLTEDLGTILKSEDRGDLRRAFEFLLTNKSVHQPKNCSLDAIDHFWHPLKVMQLVRSIHKKFNVQLSWATSSLTMFGRKSQQVQPATEKKWLPKCSLS